MRSLENSAADFACFTNDIFSYQKEIEFEGEVHNCVLVVQNFLNCNVPRAVEIVNNLMTARAQQFQHIVATELPALFDDFNLDKSTREKLLRYVEKLENWMCGILRWHITVDRYKEFELRNTASPVVRLQPRSHRAGNLGSTYQLVGQCWESFGQYSVEQLRSHS